MMPYSSYTKYGQYSGDIKVEPGSPEFSGFDSGPEEDEIAIASYNLYPEETNLYSGPSSPNSDELSLDNGVVLEPNAELQKRLCVVCGDIASGFHYGVASCEACKAFFKRIIHQNQDHSCTANGECEITKHRRKKCQACRFQKCLRMGMLKEGVRLDRTRGGHQKYKPRTDIPQTPVGVVTTTTATVKKYEEHKLLSELIRIEPDRVFAMPDPNLNDDEYKFQSTLAELADRELVATIGWARQVPDFIKLQLPDQMKLLKYSWLDIHCLNLGYRSVPYNDEHRQLVYADDFKCTEDDARRFNAPLELDEISRQLARKLTLLKITKGEYILLKAMLLFNPDMDVNSREMIQQLRNKMQAALVDYERSRGHSDYIQRFGHLLFVFPLLMQLKLLAKEFWCDVKNVGKVNLHKLLSEMLEFTGP